jgi:hypothetical protein
MLQDAKLSISNDLEKSQTRAYRPAYRNNSNASKEMQNLPDDLARIAAAWPTLPSNIKAAILMMVEGK